MKKTIFTTVAFVYFAVDFGMAASKGGNITYTPPAGKTGSPINVSITYPWKHPLNKSLKVTVEAWYSASDVDTMTIRVRPLDKKTTVNDKAAGQVFKGTRRNKKKKYSFEVTPRTKGRSYVAIDVATEKGDVKLSRTVTFLIRGGSKLDRKQWGKKRKGKQPYY